MTVRRVQCLWAGVLLAGLALGAGPAPAQDAQPCIDDPTAACLARELAALIAADPERVLMAAPGNNPILGIGHIFAQTGQDDLVTAYLGLVGQALSDKPSGYIDLSPAQEAELAAAAMGSWRAGVAIGYAAAGRHGAALDVVRAAQTFTEEWRALNDLVLHYAVAGDPDRVDALVDEGPTVREGARGVWGWLMRDRQRMQALWRSRQASLPAIAEAYRRLWAGAPDACAPLAEVPGAQHGAEFAANWLFVPEAALLAIGCRHGDGDAARSGSGPRINFAYPPLRFRRPESARILRDLLSGYVEHGHPLGRQMVLLLFPSAVLANLDPTDVQALTAAHLMLIDYEAEGWRRYGGALAHLVRRGDRAALLALIGQSSPAVANSFYGAWENVAVYAAMEGDAQLAEAILGKITRAVDQTQQATDRPCRRRSDVGLRRLIARVFAAHGHDRAARATARRVTCGGAVPPALMDVALRTGDRGMKRDAIEAAYAMEDPGERAAVFAELASMMLAAEDWGPWPQ